MLGGGEEGGTGAVTKGQDETWTGLKVVWVWETFQQRRKKRCSHKTFQPRKKILQTKKKRCMSRKKTFKSRKKM